MPSRAARSPSTSVKIALVAANDALTQTPPLSLLCLSTVLKDMGYQAEMYDLGVHPQKVSDLIEKTAAGEYLWVGFTAMTPSIPIIKKYINSVRRASSAIPLVLGGIHASSLPEETLRELDVDVICVGDGEEAVKALTRKIVRGETNYWEVPGLACIDGNGVYHFSEDKARSRDLHPFPRPDWDKVDFSDYQRCPMQYVRKGRRVAPVVITKGCPNNCSFCAQPALFGRTLKKRDPLEVVDEIEYLVRDRGVDEIHILDDNFNHNLEYAKSVLREWVKRDIRVFWKAPQGIWIHACDDEWFSLLKKTGCYQLSFGIESGSKDILKRANKRIELDAVHDILNKYNEHGISTFGFFILGLPGESKETISQTISFARKLPLNHIHVSLFTPYPGSPLFYEAIRNGMECPKWDDYYHYHHSESFLFCNLKISELRRALKYFYATFYINPKRLFGLISTVRCSGIRPFMAIARKIIE